jgi:hypothetical protein
MDQNRMLRARKFEIAGSWFCIVAGPFLFRYFVYPHGPWWVVLVPIGIGVISLTFAVPSRYRTCESVKPGDERTNDAANGSH